jgi:myosin-7
LLKQNREYDQEAVQSFKNIMSFMGDRKSSKDGVGHIKKLIQNGLTAPETLRDEIYLQICKQVTGHPNESNALKGWELMCVLMGCFPPSMSMKEFLQEFIERAKNEESNDAGIKRLAKLCLERMDKIMILGPRLEVSSEQEIKHDQAGEVTSLKVYTLDDAFKTVEADCFTQVKEVKRTFVQKMGLGYSLPFGLFEVAKDGTERVLEDDMRVLDVLGAWERVVSEKRLPGGSENFRLVFKAELVLKTSDKNLLEDEEALNLMYMQAVHDVVTERYPSESKDCPSLAALQLQASFGDYKADTHTIDWIVDQLPRLLPEPYYGGNKGKKNEAVRNEAAQKVLSKYTKLTGVSSNEAKLSYLDYVQDWPLYGAAFVTVEQKQLKDYPTFIRVAITCDNVLLVHPDTRDVLDTFAYNEIVTWGYSDEKFILVVGNLVQQRKLFFKTNKGRFMNKLVHDYVKTKVPAS